MAKKITDERMQEFEEQSKLPLATMEYDIDHGQHFSHEGFYSKKHLQAQLEQAKEAVNKKKMTMVKNWLRDFTEEREHDLGLQKYVLEKTGIQLNLREKLLKRIQKTIDRGRVNTDNQFYDLMNEVDFLCQQQKPNKKRIEMLNLLIANYEERASKRNKKST